ncbi:DUF3304 domain-containing protein, partial [Cobetia sp. MMG027]|uniref:DUF3304 domain-containing protein n=1 Tax=Cobetia sp. MMG027 TaxID=3021980 RepID=UPI0022FE7BEE
SMAPYGAGGIRCCYEVPKQWHEGLMVEVETYYPLVGDTIEERSEDLGQREATGTVTEKVKVPVPEYQAPAEGTLWVQFMPDKNIKVVVSELSPEHENFPGDVKGWPVPSDEYRISLIDRDIGLAEDDLKLSISRLKEWTNEPTDEALKSSWDAYKKYFKKELKDFSGYKDPRFLSYLIKESKINLSNERKKIRKLKLYKESLK